MNSDNRVTCLICGKPIKTDDVYCDEHKDYARRDDKIIQEMPFEILFSLIMGVFTRARQDYMLNPEGQRSDAEWFFRSEWAQELSLSQFDPEEVLKLMDEEVKNGIK